MVKHGVVIDYRYNKIKIDKDELKMTQSSMGKNTTLNTI